MKVQKFEDLEVWRQARGLVQEVYEAAKENRGLTEPNQPKELNKPRWPNEEGIETSNSSEVKSDRIEE